MTDTSPSNTISRREFLYRGSFALIGFALRDTLRLADLPNAQNLGLQVAQSERRHIAQISGLQLNEPLMFRYPYDHPTAENFLIKIGVAAGGGVGPDHDIIAFHSICTHQGGPLAGTYKPQHQALGPCPLHLTTFDLTRHGMVIAGHATQGLPQIILEEDGDDLFAVGVMGLIYGYFDNQVNPTGIGG